MLMRIKRLKLFGNFYHYCGLGFLKTWLVYMDPVWSSALCIVYIFSRSESGSTWPVNTEHPALAFLASLSRCHSALVSGSGGKLVAGKRAHLNKIFQY